MSLINRMLRDLSARENRPADVRSGIQIPHEQAAVSSNGKRIGLFLALIGVFTAGLWWMFGPRPIKVPQPRGELTASAPAAAPAPAPAAAAAAAPAPTTAAPAPAPAPTEVAVAPAPPPPPPPAEPTHLKLDETLTTAAAGAKPASAAPHRAPRPAAPASKPRPPAAPKLAVKMNPAPVAPAPAKAAPETAAQTAPAEVASGSENATPSQPQAAVAVPTATPVAERIDAKQVSGAAQRYADGRRKLELGDDKGAEEDFAAALALDPKLHRAREDLGTLRIRQGRFEEAERSVRRGLEEDPGWVGYRRLIARLELARGRPAGAVEALEHDPPSVQADPEYAALLASAYQRMNRHEEAARLYAALTQAQPERAQWWAAYGLSRDALGDGPRALAAYERARQLGGLDPRVLEHINKRTAALQTAG